MENPEPNPLRPASESQADRRMVQAELLGSHLHTTGCGVAVHVWIRQAVYLARGSYQKRRFGKTLGTDRVEAASALRRLLTEIEDGSFVRPTEARHRPLSKGLVPRLTLRQLVNEFLAEKRKLRGQRTAKDYRARLMPALEFAEKPASRKRWPLAASLNHDFAVEMRAFLVSEWRTTRNGRAGSTPKTLSTRQVYNVLDCLRSMFHWARRPEVRKLPVDWANPIGEDMIGGPPRKNPLRDQLLPLEERIALVDKMDRWQLCHLALSLTLPLRPDEARRPKKETRRLAGRFFRFVEMR